MAREGWLRYVRILAVPGILLPILAFLAGLSVYISIPATKPISVFFALPVAILIGFVILLIYSLGVADRALREISRSDSAETGRDLDWWILRLIAATGFVFSLVEALYYLYYKYWMSAGIILLVSVLITLYYFSPGLEKGLFLQGLYRYLLTNLIPFICGWTIIGKQNFSFLRNPEFWGLVMILGFLQIGSEFSSRSGLDPGPVPVSKWIYPRIIFTSLPFILLPLGGQLKLFNVKNDFFLILSSLLIYAAIMMWELFTIKYLRQRQAESFREKIIIFMGRRWGDILVGTGFLIIIFAYKHQKYSFF